MTMFRKVITLSGLYVLLIAVLPLFFASCTTDTEDLDTPPAATIAEDVKELEAAERDHAQEPVADWLMEMGETEKELWGDIATLKAAIKAREQRLEEKERVLVQRGMELETREANIQSREASFRQTELIVYGIFAVSIILIIAVIISEIRSRQKGKRSDDVSTSSRRSTEGAKGKTRGAKKKTDRESSPDSPTTSG
jgi:uncharacterized membrane protein